MPRKTKEPYLCPRCNYETRSRPDMKKHLYNLKKSCPGQVNDIELTEEIKQKILSNRVYTIEQQTIDKEGCTFNFNKYIFDMDTTDKLNRALEFSEANTINFGDKIESTYSAKIKKLEDRSYKYGFQLGHTDFLEVVDKSVQLGSTIDLRGLNLLYINELNKIAIYHDDEWTHYLFDSGLNKIITIIRNYYLESYEKYILYKIFVDKEATAIECNTYKNQLNEYFQFLACFDIFPSSKDQDNLFLPGFSHNDNFYLSKFTIDRYNEQLETLKKSDKNKIRKTVGDIIKAHNGANVKLLNKYIINLAVNNEAFKTHLLGFAK